MMKHVLNLNSGIFKFILILATSVLLTSYLLVNSEKEENILWHVVDPLNDSLYFIWKDKDDSIVNTIKRLKKILDPYELIFAMNGGMFKKDYSPKGLYIENGILKSPVDTIRNGYGNFYLQPNGIFLIDNSHKAMVCKATDFKMNNRVKYATQSGPLLIIEGEIHPAFNNGSVNLNIRNGVGILPDNKIVFAMSKEKINFYDFAMFFKNKGCYNALYLDGFVSRTYLPEKGFNKTEGNFGVIIYQYVN